ncbi:hypothetical protein BC826DRAFT_100 [Russula brevipes]|nr:hypothetical protein BC826DRAFT_100 [Russula brevipes]
MPYERYCTLISKVFRRKGMNGMRNWNWSVRSGDVRRIPGRWAGASCSVQHQHTFSFSAQRSTNAMVRARLSAADILHRGVVLSLVGVCIWGVGTGILVHRDTVRMGKEVMRLDSCPIRSG